jgi:hypothetical protein
MIKMCTPVKWHSRNPESFRGAGISLRNEEKLWTLQKDEGQASRNDRVENHFTSVSQRGNRAES